jgi:hypothetical protein
VLVRDVQPTGQAPLSIRYRGRVGLFFK